MTQKKDFLKRCKLPSLSCGTLLELNLYPCCTIIIWSFTARFANGKSFVRNLFFCGMELKENRKQPEDYMFLICSGWSLKFWCSILLVDTKVAWNGLPVVQKGSAWSATPYPAAYIYLMLIFNELCLQFFCFDIE
jgi:hypothetical protein